MINLNDDVFDNASGIQIFNNGETGIAHNIIGSRIEIKKDSSNNPDYKLFFKDSNGSEINIAFWYLDNNKDSFSKDLERQGKMLKHLTHCYMGHNYQFPPFESTKEMLDNIIKLISSKFTTTFVRVYCTYGTTQSPKKYLQIRNYVPFIENESISIQNTVLKKSNIDQMTRLEEDKPQNITPMSDIF